MTPDAAQIFNEIASHYHGRMQQAGTWAPWGDYWIEIVNCKSPADWTVHARNRIVAKGEADTVLCGWEQACQAIAADLALEAA